MMAEHDHAWWAMVVGTAHALYHEELARHIDPSGEASLILQALDGGTADTMRAWLRESAEWHELHDPTPVPPILPLSIVGTTFRTPDGLPWKWRGLSWFRGLRQYLDGADLDPVFAWARAHEVNLLRVFSRLSWAGLRETDYLDSALREFADLVAAAGFRLELVALADCAVEGWRLDPAGQQRHLDRLSDVLGDHPAVLFEAANEPTHSTNHVSISALRRPARGLWSRGSTHADEDPTIPVWDFHTDHCPRKDEWPRTAKNLLEFARLGYGPENARKPGLNVPCVGDEPQKAGAGYDLDPQHFADYAAVAEMMAAGSTLHLQSIGLDGMLPGEAEENVAQAVAAVWRAGIPAQAAEWQYTRGGLGDNPIEHSDETALRSFAMLHGNEAVAVIVGKKYAGPPVGRNGWRVVKTATVNESIAFLER